MKNNKLVKFIVLVIVLMGSFFVFTKLAGNGVDVEEEMIPVESDGGIGDSATPLDEILNNQ